MRNKFLYSILLALFFLCESHSLKGKEWAPDFIIVGAQKAATGALREFVVQHPMIVFSRKREVHFFDLNFQKGPLWYKRQFRERPTSDHLLGEKSPYYIVHPAVPERVFSLYPNVKIVMILRNPVSRAYSHYHFNVRNGDEELSFEQAIEMESTRLAGLQNKLKTDPEYKSTKFKNYSYLTRGRYVEQVKRWLKFFPMEHILIITSEELNRDPVGVMNEVFSFLGLSPLDNLEIAHEESGYPPMDPKTRKQLVEYFRPYNQKLMKLLGRTFDWDK